MQKNLMMAIVVAAMGFVGMATAATAQEWGDVDCVNFATQQEAQAFFIQNGGPWLDPHYLDADSDGIACELLASSSW